MKQTTAFFILTLLVSLWLGVARPVQAQTEEASAEGAQMDTTSEGTADEMLVFEKPSVQAEIEVAKETYRRQFEAYRTAERAFEVSKQQFQQLATLASLEDAVKSSREVMRLRGEVLLTYLEVLRLELSEAEGIEVAAKDQAMSDIVDQITGLRAHVAQVEAIQTRAEVGERAAEFATLSPQLQEVSYRILSLLNIGKLRVVYDKANAITNELQSSSSVSNDPLKQAERDRAFTETFRVLGEAQNQFQTVDLELERAKGKHTQATFNIVNRQLGKVYASLSQIISYLEELT